MPTGWPRNYRLFLYFKADMERHGIPHGFEQKKQNQIVSLDLHLPHTQTLPCTSVHSKTMKYTVLGFGIRSTFNGHQTTQKVQFPIHIGNDKETNTTNNDKETQHNFRIFLC